MRRSATLLSWFGAAIGCHAGDKAEPLAISLVVRAKT
jgi:hypothetical protein